MTSLKRFIEGQLEISPPKNVTKKPVQFLGQLLKLVGLKQVQVSSRREDNKKICFYRIDQVSVETMNFFLENRTEVTDWKSHNSRYHASYNEDDYDELEKRDIFLDRQTH